MNYTDLIAHNLSDYVDKALKLVRNDTFRELQHESILVAFHQKLNKNFFVAQEWVHFFANAWRSLYGA